MKVSRITRLLEVITLLQAGHGQNASSLATECGVSRRTIFRDLDVLRLAGVPLQFDDEHQRYRIAGPILLPPTNFTPQEALAMMVVSHELGQNGGLPLYGAARTAAAKLESSLPPRLRSYVRDAADAVQIRFDSVNRLAAHEGTYEHLLSAVTRRRNVRIRYNSLMDQEHIGTKLSPYRLFFNRRSWYVVGRSSVHRAVRTFNVGRILSLEPLEEAFKVPRGFKLERILRNAWNLMAERGPDQEVTVRFSKMVAQNVAEIMWHNTQRIEQRDDGSIDFHVTVSGLTEISWWILGYGDQAVVIQPKKLRDIVVQRCRALLQHYELLNSRNGG